MSTLTPLVLTAILSLARAPAVTLPEELPRLEALAEAIAGAVDEAQALEAWLPGTGPGLPFTGAAAPEASALALVAIAHHESGFRAAVSDCRIVGTDHPSITAWQLWGPFARGPYSRRALCAEPRLAAERALWTLAHHAERTRTPAGAFRGYASGDPAVRSRAAARQCALWERLARAAGLVASCGRRDVR